MSELPTRSRPLLLATACILTLLLATLPLATPALGDWLITTHGEMIETDGPWTVEDDLITFVDTEGNERRLDLGKVDLEGSKETTAMKAGRAYEPELRNVETSAAAPAVAAADDEPKITLYMTSWCGYCRKPASC